MKLLDLYEDLFQYLCALNRVTRGPATSQAPLQRSEVKLEIDRLLKEVERRADQSQDRQLPGEVRAMERSMVFFVDNVICSSRLGFASEWASKRLADERFQILTGDRDFFTMLDRDLQIYNQQRTEDAQERLAVYYACLGLGFTGIHVRNPQEISNYMDKILGAISPLVDQGVKEKLAPETYKSTIQRDITKPPRQSIILVTVAFVVLIVSVAIVYWGRYAGAVGELEPAINGIVGARESAGKTP